MRLQQRITKFEPCTQPVIAFGHHVNNDPVQLGLNEFDAFYAEEQVSAIVTHPVDSSHTSRPALPPDTPTSFEAKRKSLQANVYRAPSDRPPDRSVQLEVGVTPINKTCDYSPKRGDPPTKSVAQ